MTKQKERMQAVSLRQRGWSLGEISYKLKISKGTISLWCRGIVLSPFQIKRLSERQKAASSMGRLKSLEHARKKRLAEIENLRKVGIKEIGKLTPRDLFISGTALYWAEGYKTKSNGELGFTNSDPKMILFFFEWLKRCCSVVQERLVLKVTINEIHKTRLAEIENYWSKITKIPRSQFTKTTIIKTKHKKTFPNPQDYYGTLRVKVRNGTKLRRKIMGWIEGLGRRNNRYTSPRCGV